VRNMTLLETVKQTILKQKVLQGGETIVVGVSGGPDSLCLLHALRKLQPELELGLHLAHLEHGIRGAESRADAAFITELANSWRIRISIEHADVPAYAREHRLAIEEAARRVRYLFLSRVVGEVGASCAAVGHNADDQVETILMHWMRGSGLAGLRGMLAVQTLGEEGWWTGPTLKVIRPLLEVSRTCIEEYCQEHGLRPRFDRSNLDLTYHRNRIRHELIPHLESFNPRICEVLLRSARVFADDLDYLSLQADEAWERLARESNGSVSFPLDPWYELHPALQRQLLREAIRRLRTSLRDITWTHVERAREGLASLEAGGRITLAQGLFLIKSYTDFTIGEQVVYPDLPLLWETPVSLRVPGITSLPDSNWSVDSQILERAELPAEAMANPDPWQAYVDLDTTGSDLMLRRRETGDAFEPLGMGGRSKNLTDFMIDAKIPQRIRSLLPLVVSPWHIVWVAGYRIDERVKVTSETSRVLHLGFAREG
jgi:tRNA(Ile)-lysidine synthase